MLVFSQALPYHQVGVAGLIFKRYKGDIVSAGWPLSGGNDSRRMHIVTIFFLCDTIAGNDTKRS